MVVFQILTFVRNGYIEEVPGFFIEPKWLRTLSSLCTFTALNTYLWSVFCWLSGMYLGMESDDKFEKHTESLLTLLESQRKIYETEEKTLKVRHDKLQATDWHRFNQTQTCRVLYYMRVYTNKWKRNCYVLRRYYALVMSLLIYLYHWPEGGILDRLP